MIRTPKKAAKTGFIPSGPLHLKMIQLEIRWGIGEGDLLEPIGKLLEDSPFATGSDWSRGLAGWLNREGNKLGQRWKKASTRGEGGKGTGRHWMWVGVAAAGLGTCDRMA
jgi:hypothetical protein